MGSEQEKDLNQLRKKKARALEILRAQEVFKNIEFLFDYVYACHLKYVSSNEDEFYCTRTNDEFTFETPSGKLQIIRRDLNYSRAPMSADFDRYGTLEVLHNSKLVYSGNCKMRTSSDFESSAFEADSAGNPINSIHLTKSWLLLLKSVVGICKSARGDLAQEAIEKARKKELQDLQKNVNLEEFEDDS